MPTINDILEKEGIDPNPMVNLEPEDGQTQEKAAPVDTGLTLRERFPWLFAEPGPGEVADYLDHPLNFKKSLGLAQIIRGMTGLLGNLRLAFVDILLGAFRLRLEGLTSGQVK